MSNEEYTVNPPPANGRDYVNKKVRDARGDLVSDKAANQPFLAYRQFKVQEEQRAREKAEKIQRRKDKIARGEALGPEDELEPEPSLILAFLKFVLFCISAGLFAGWFITGSPLWEYNGKWVDWRSLIPSDQTAFSERQLARFDGSDPLKPVYLAIDGDVYDVSAGRNSYGPQGGYHVFAGVDASRAFATACLTGHRTHDLRGLTAAQLESRDKWKDFFAKSTKYKKIGRVSHKPIDPKSPIPGPCPKERDFATPQPVAGPQAPPPVDKAADSQPRKPKEEL